LNDTHTPRLNLSKLTDLLWTGGDLPDPPSEAWRTIRAWQALGIHAVVDNRVEWSDEELVAAVAPEMSYLHAGVDDAGQAMPDWWFETVASFAAGHINRGLRVLVHCHMGINRGPSAAFAVLLATGWEPIDAIDLIRISRPIAAVGYAEDALDWWHRRADMSDAERLDQRQRLIQWRQANPHDTVRIIREIERSGRAS
jgi:dual specificity phosphatase 3